MVVSETIELQTRGHADMLDVTDQVAERVSASGLTAGIATVFCPGSTGGVTTIEYESGALSDLGRTFDEVVPPDREYAHNRRWGDGNGHSHVRAALLGPSLAVPFSDGELMLGTWQQIVFIDFDVRSRSRRLIVQILGE